MTNVVVHSQPAYILHQKNYSESSLIIDALTQDFGRVSLIAKGVRKAKSKTIGILRPFMGLSLSFLGKAELKTLTDVEQIGSAHELKGLALYCGFYVNELVCNFLHKYDPHPEVFENYQVCLSGLQQEANIENALRQFEFNLLENSGYGVQLDYDIANEKPIELPKKYRFNTGEGLIEDANGLFSGSALLAMQQRQFQDSHVLTEAKMLMRMVIDSHLQGKPLRSRAVINDIFKRL